MDITDDPRKMLEDILVIPDTTDTRALRESTAFTTTEDLI